MRVLILASQPTGGGNRSTCERIAQHLESAGHEVRSVDLADCSLSSQLREVANDFKAELALGVHALRSAPFLELCACPHMVILSGTDVNEFAKLPEKRKRMEGVLQSSRLVVSLSESLAGQAVSLWPWLEGKLRVIPQAVLPVSPSSFSLRESLGLRKEASIFLLPAGLREVKDVLFLQNYFESTAVRESEEYLVVVGAALDESYTRRFFELTESNAHIHCAGLLKRVDLFTAMKQSLAVINTSRSEAIPQALLEAMSLGVPVIARDIPGNREAVGEEGLLFEDELGFAQCVAKLRDERSSQRQAALDRVERFFSLESERKAYVELLRE